MILICIATLIINNSPDKFGSDPRDIKGVERATKVCRTDARYKDSPCLVKFIKKENGVYWSLCGEKRTIYTGV